MIKGKRRLLLGALALLGVLLLSACGSNTNLTGASWPGISVAEEEQIVYLAYGTQVFAFDWEDYPNSDEVLWAFPGEPDAKRTFYASPALAGDLVIVADYIDTLYALDPQTGEEQWRYTSDRSRFIGGVAMDEDTVYTGTVNGVVHYLDRETGKEKWSYQIDLDIWATPLLTEDGTLYVTSLDGHVYAFDTQNPALKWRFPKNPGDEGEPAMGGIVSTPVLYGDLLYFSSFNNILYALDITTQKIVWRYETTNWMWSSPAIDEEEGLLIGGDLNGLIFALDAASGKEVWRYEEATGPIVGQPALSEMDDGTRVVYATSDDTHIYVLKLEDGRQALPPGTVDVEFTSRFLFITTGSEERAVPIYAPPVLIDGLLLVGVHEGEFPLYALDAESMAQQWKFDPTGRTSASSDSGGEGDGEEEEPSAFQSTLNLLLPLIIVMLLFQLLGQRRGQDKK